MSRLPLELWRHIFTYLDLPQYEVKIAHWPGRFPECKFKFLTEESARTTRVLTCEDVLFRRSSDAVWQWIIAEATWKVDSETDSWRLCRLEKDFNSSIRHVSMTVDLTTGGLGAECANTPLPPETLEVLKDLAKLRGLQTLTISIDAPIYLSGDEILGALIQLHSVVEAPLQTMRQRQSAKSKFVVHMRACQKQLHPGGYFYFVPRQSQDVTGLWNDLKHVQLENPPTSITRRIANYRSY